MQLHQAIVGRKATPACRNAITFNRKHYGVQARVLQGMSGLPKREKRSMPVISCRTGVFVLEGAK